MNTSEIIQNTYVEYLPDGTKRDRYRKEFLKKLQLTNNNTRKRKCDTQKTYETKIKNKNKHATRKRTTKNTTNTTRNNIRKKWKKHLVLKITTNKNRTCKRRREYDNKTWHD